MSNNEEESYHKEVSKHLNQWSIKTFFIKARNIKGQLLDHIVIIGVRSIGLGLCVVDKGLEVTRIICLIRWCKVNGSINEDGKRKMEQDCPRDKVMILRNESLIQTRRI